MTNDRMKLSCDGAYKARWAKVLGLWAMVAVAACGQRGDQREESDVVATHSEALNNVPPTLGWPAQPVVTGRTVGTLSGSGHVNPMGAYEYSLPLEVPPGRAGMSPKISLDYASTGPNGLLGVGWSLGGLSAIHPCDYSIATDSEAASDDKQGVCLDGNRIIKERTESDIVAAIVDNKTVYLKNGRIRTYGPVGPENFSVLLSEQDRSGNSITYVYSHAGKLTARGDKLDDANATEIYLMQILYTGRVPVDDTGSRSVFFEYEPRPDPIYVEHSLVNPYGSIGTTQRLKTITMSAPAPLGTGTAVGPTTEAWHYDLSYYPSATSSRSLLSSVTQTGALGGKKFAKNFDWTSSQGGSYDDNNLAFPNIDPAHGVIALDVDNDGRDEMIVESLPGLIMLWSTPAGTPMGGPMLTSAQPLNGLINATLTDASIGDLDGDGVPEIVAPDRNFDAAGNKAYGVYKWSSASHDYVLAGVNPGGSPYNTAQSVEQPIYLADMDGDGLPDLIQAYYAPFPSSSNQIVDPTCVWSPGPTRPRCFGYSWRYKHNEGGSFGAAKEILSSLSTFNSPGQSQSASIDDYPPMSGSPFSSFQIPERGSRAKLFAAIHFKNLQSSDFNANGFRLAPGDDAPKLDLTDLKVSPLCSLGDFKGRGGPDFECFDPMDAGFPSSDPTGWTVHNFDVDGDGRDDLVAYTYLINPFRVGNAFYVHYDITGQKLTEKLSRAPILGGDFDGDGRRDIYGYDLANDRVFIGSSLPTSDLLTGVSDESAYTAPGKEGVTYTQQWSPAPVAAKACVHPQRCIRHGLTVVKSHAVDTGAGFMSTYYNYDDPRYDVQGRGFLGFGTVREWNPDRPSETITTYDNVTPDKGVYLAFLPKSVQRYIPIDPSLKGVGTESVNVRASQVTIEYAIDFNGPSFLRHPKSWESNEWETTAKLDWTTGVIQHFDGFSPSPILRKRYGSYVYDSYGNEINADAHTQDGDFVTTTTTYENRIADWLIGLPQKVLTSESGLLGAVNNRKVEFTHDALGRLVNVYIEQGDADPEIPETLTYEYNADGLPLSLTDTAVGEPPRHIFTQYDPEEGIFQRKVWNDLGHATQMLAHPVFCAPSNTLDPNGVSGQTIFDEFGRVRRTVQTGGPTIDIDLNARMDSFGYVVGSTISIHGNGVVSSYTELDTAGRKVLAQHTGFDGTPVVQTVQYDRLGRVVFASRPGLGTPDSNGTKYQYDSMDRRRLTTLPDGTPITETPTFFEHHTVDGDLDERYLVRDIEGRVSSSVQMLGAQKLATAFTYGDFHQLVTTTDPLQHDTKIKYDKRGRRKRVVDLDTGISTTHYNGFGEVVSVESPSVQKSLFPALTTYTRDVLGRVTQIDTVDGATQTTSKFTWDTGLNGLGLPATTESPDHVVRTFDYDGAGRPWKETWQVNGELFEVLTTYDSSGRVANTTYPNVLARSSRFKVKRMYTGTGYELAAAEVDVPATPTFWTVNARNVDDQLVDGSFGNGLVDHRTYYPTTGRLRSIEDGHSGGPGGVLPLFSLQYDYYPGGQVKSRADSIRSRGETFTYDSIHRLTSWELKNLGATRKTSYDYDEIGNLKTVWLDNAVAETNSYKCDDTSCPGPHALISSTVGATKSTFGYDERGRQRTTPTRTVVFNEHNLPQSIGNAQFFYDAGGTRVKKNDTTGETISIGGVYERRTNGTSVQHVFYVPGTDGMMTQVVYDQTTNTDHTEYLHRDALGTVGAVSSQAGALTFYDHEPFGAGILPSGLPAAPSTGDVRLGFTGHMADDALGLVDMKGRIYDPSQRHFITPDPLIPYPLNTQSYNRYSYVENDPINRTDPSGFSDDSGTSSTADFAPILFAALFNSATFKASVSFGAPATPVYAPAAPKFQTARLPAPSAHRQYVQLVAPPVAPLYHFDARDYVGCLGICVYQRIINVVVNIPNLAWTTGQHFARGGEVDTTGEKVIEGLSTVRDGAASVVAVYGIATGISSGLAAMAPEVAIETGPTALEIATVRAQLAEAARARAAAAAAEEAAAVRYGPYVHHVNKGGLPEILESRVLIAGQQGNAGFGGEAVRAYSQDISKLDPTVMKVPAIVFRTTTPPTGINPGQNAVSWQTDRLTIIIDKVISPAK